MGARQLGPKALATARDGERVLGPSCRMPQGHDQTPGDLVSSLSYFVSFFFFRIAAAASRAKADLLTDIKESWHTYEGVMAHISRSLGNVCVCVRACVWSMTVRARCEQALICHSACAHLEMRACMHACVRACMDECVCIWK